MARLTPETLTYEGIEEPVKIICPDGWQKAERAIIRLNVVSRDPRIGTVDYSRIIPREFTGYWYLYKQKYQYDVGKIDFKTQEIYRDYDFWKAEIVSQQMAQRVPVIEVTQPEENIEESLELALFLGEVLTGIAGSFPDIALIDNFIEIVTDFFANLSSNDLTYLPTPYRPDTLYIDFPAGLATVDIEFIWFPFSPISFGSGAAEIPIESNIFPIFSLPSNRVTEPEQASQAETFEQRAERSGFVRSSNLPQACQSIGYVNEAESLKQIWRDSGFLPLQIRQKLLEQGAISQSQIDEILSENPSYSDEQILDRLIEKGYISAQELSKATNALSISETFPLRGKKAAWIYAIRSVTPSCADSLGRWTLIAHWYDSFGQVISAVVWNSQRNFPVPSQLPWGSIGNGNYNMITSATFIPNYGNLCGQSVGLGMIFVDGVKVRERGDLLEAPRWFWVRQP